MQLDHGLNDDFLQYVLEQLAGLGQHVIPRRMFGGVGLYYVALTVGAY